MVPPGLPEVNAEKIATKGIGPFTKWIIACANNQVVLGVIQIPRVPRRVNRHSSFGIAADPPLRSAS